MRILRSCPENQQARCLFLDPAPIEPAANMQVPRDYLASQSSTAFSADVAEKNDPSGENAKLLLTMHPFGFLPDRRNPALMTGGIGESSLSTS